MTKRLSEFYGLDIYSIRGEYVGRVEEIILNLEKGVVMSLCLKPLKEISAGSNEVKRVLKEDSVGYDAVTAVDEVVLIKNKPVRDAGKIRKVKKDEELDSVSMGQE